LTVAGLAHLEPFHSTVTMFLRVVARLAEERAAAQFDPLKVVEVIIPFDRLTTDLDMTTESLVSLRELLASEPATWHNQTVQGDGGAWLVHASPFVRRFRGVETIAEYVTRLRAWVVPPVPDLPPAPASPLAVVAAFDYLDVVWRLKFGNQLVVVPSAERAARLAFDADTAEEFDNRPSALGEMLKGLTVPGASNLGPLKRLTAYLPDHLRAEAMGRVEHSIKTLQAVTHVRNGGQHVGAVGDAVTALPSLGLTFPVTDYEGAWRMIQAHVVAALDTLREEIRATITAAPGT
jgi:hypothetical protein